MRPEIASGLQAGHVAPDGLEKVVEVLGVANLDLLGVGELLRGQSVNEKFEVADGEAARVVEESPGSLGLDEPGEPLGGGLRPPGHGFGRNEVVWPSGGKRLVEDHADGDRQIENWKAAAAWSRKMLQMISSAFPWLS